MSIMWNQIDSINREHYFSGDFDLVCGRDVLIDFAQTIYFVGMIFGVLTFGILADILGRKSVLIILLLFACLTGK